MNFQFFILDVWHDKNEQSFNLGVGDMTKILYHDITNSISQ